MIHLKDHDRACHQKAFCSCRKALDMSMYARTKGVFEASHPTAPPVNHETLVAFFEGYLDENEELWKECEEANVREKMSYEDLAPHTPCSRWIELVLGHLDIPWKIYSEAMTISVIEEDGSQTEVYDGFQYICQHAIWRQRYLNALYLWEQEELQDFSDLLFYRQCSTAAVHERMKYATEEGLLWKEWVEKYEELRTFRDKESFTNWFLNTKGEGKKSRRMIQCLWSSREADCTEQIVRGRKLSAVCLKGRCCYHIRTILDVPCLTFPTHWKRLKHRHEQLVQWKKGEEVTCYLHGLPVWVEGKLFGHWNCTCRWNGAVTSGTMHCKTPDAWFEQQKEDPLHEHADERFPGLIRVLHPHGEVRGLHDVYVCNTDWLMFCKCATRRSKGQPVKSVLRLLNDDRIVIQMPLRSDLFTCTLEGKYPSFLRKVKWTKETLFDQCRRLGITSNVESLYQTYVVGHSPHNVDQCLSYHRGRGIFATSLRTQREIPQTIQHLTALRSGPEQSNHQTFLKCYFLSGNIESLFHDWKALKTHLVDMLVGKYADLTQCQSLEELKIRRVRYRKVFQKDFFFTATNPHGLLACLFHPLPFLSEKLVSQLQCTPNDVNILCSWVRNIQQEATIVRRMDV